MGVPPRQFGGEEDVARFAGGVLAEHGVGSRAGAEGVVQKVRVGQGVGARRDVNDGFGGLEEVSQQEVSQVIGRQDQFIGLIHRGVGRGELLSLHHEAGVVDEHVNGRVLLEDRFCGPPYTREVAQVAGHCVHRQLPITRGWGYATGNVTPGFFGLFDAPAGHDDGGGVVFVRQWRLRYPFNGRTLLPDDG